MAQIVFYEKPGCINNTRQKELLKRSGHTVDARSLLTAAWTPATLRPFFGERPVAEWFNRAAPQVKSGEVTPERITDEAEALAMMCANPLLIRRPLMEVGDRRSVGFDEAAIAAWIGLATAPAIGEDCPKGDPEPCITP